MEKNTIKYNWSRKQKKVFRGHTVWAGWIEIMWWKQSIASLCPLNRFGYFFDKKYQTNPEFGKWKWDNSSRERGSALLVTIMITSVVLLFAMILLERIIPYSKQIRGMQDSVQSYYTARSQVELARKEFWVTARENIGTIGTSTDGSPALATPSLDSDNLGQYVIVSEHTRLPLRIRLFEDDTNARGFGINQKNPFMHNLSSLSWMLFDLSDRDTANLSMEIETEWEDATIEKNIAIEFVHNNTTAVTPFFGNLWGTSLDGMDIVDAEDANGETLGNKLGGINCADASCSLKISLTNSTTPLESLLLPVSFTLSTAIPDLNAVIVADGISSNTTYHSRIIELIPLIQGI